MNKLICIILQIPHISDVIFVFVWLTYFSMIISRFIHIAANASNTFILWLNNIPLYRWNQPLFYASICWCMGCFHALAFVNTVAMDIGVSVSFQFRVFIFSGHMPKSGIAGSYGNSIFSFLRNLYSAIAIMHSCCIIYIPTNSIGEFPFLHTFPSVYYWSFWLVWGNSSL